MSAQDVQELTSDITKAKKVLGAAVASVAGVEATEVTVTKIWVNGVGEARRLEGDDSATTYSIDAEFQIVSAKSPATSLKASELAAAIEREAKAEGIEVKVESVESSIEIASSPPAAPPKDDDSSWVVIFLIVIAVCLVSIGMIGGFIYWYYRYSASKQAGTDESNIV